MAPKAASYAPTLEKLLKSLKSQSLEASVDSLVSLLKRRQIRGPEACAVATAHILLQVVAKGRWKDVYQLLDQVQQVGRKLVQAKPRELVIANVVRRVLGLIRDEAEEERNEFGSDSLSDLRDVPASPEPVAPPPKSSRPPMLSMSTSYIATQSLFNLLASDLAAESQGSTGTTTPTGRAQAASNSALRSEVIDGIEEIKDEISQVDDQIAAFAELQIHPGDFVMVYQPSPTVERFLTRAASKRKFTVLLAGTSSKRNPEEAPFASLRKKLTAAKCKSIVISCSGIMAFMPKINKVIIDARSIVSGGGVIADSGAGLLARASHDCGKPVICLGGIYKISPDEPNDLYSLLEYDEPASRVNFTDGTLVDGIEVENAVTDYIDPTLIDLYVTNLGPHSGDHLQTVIADHYKQEDVNFY